MLAHVQIVITLTVLYWFF